MKYSAMESKGSSLQGLKACCVFTRRLSIISSVSVPNLHKTVVQEVEKSFSNQKVVCSIPCRSVLEQDTEPLIAPDVQCAISVNVKRVYIVSRTYVSRFG